jgi:hypothetical protein
VKAVSGKDFAKQLEKMAGNCEKLQEVTTSTPQRDIPPVYQFPFMETRH